MNKEKFIDNICNDLEIEGFSQIYDVEQVDKNKTDFFLGNIYESSMSEISIDKFLKKIEKLEVKTKDFELYFWCDKGWDDEGTVIMTIDISSNYIKDTNYNRYLNKIIKILDKFYGLCHKYGY